MAKVDARKLSAFLADPGECRVVLLYGEDGGLARERADALTRLVSGGDDLCVIDVPREGARDAGLLAAEAATRALLGGKRGVRVRDATDGFAAGAKQALDGPGPGLVILEAGELTARAKLRALLEPAPRAAVIACYRERGAELAATARGMLAEMGVTIDAAALEWLVQNQGEDRIRMRRELEKLSLYVGPGNRATEDDVLLCVAEGNSRSLDEALGAAFAGDVAGADAALEASFADGANAVQGARMALRHAQRLAQAAQAMADGMSAGDALGTLRPPVFFRARPAMERALRNWGPARLEALATALLETERRTKTTGMPDETVFRQAVLTIARQAARR
ncbi:MAG: DNA polymerase III subunit delta [Rubritepida sp.]|nr:DNA polymerase III subunit delta [Rubritepida sp.]